MSASSDPGLLVTKSVYHTAKNSS